MKLFVTRDKDEALVLSNKKMIKRAFRWDLPPSKQSMTWNMINLPNNWLPAIKWNDSIPTEVEISIKDGGLKIKRINKKNNNLNFTKTKEKK